MRHLGVHYDTGVQFDPRWLSRPDFDPALAQYDMRVIAQDLHATSVRIVGEHLDRLETTARLAHAAGLSVFFNPWPIGLDLDAQVDRFAEAARTAQRLRADGVELVFVAGCEASIFALGLIPGDRLEQRIDWLVSQRGGQEAAPLSVPEVGEATKAFMRRVVEVVRREFEGEVTYAAGSWEDVDWSEFDYVGVDYYRAEQSSEDYAAGLRALQRHGKPVLVLEFGCCAYVGADRRGGMGWMILDASDDADVIWRNGGPPTRDEGTQARYVTEQLGIFDNVGIEGAFVFTFDAPYLAHSDDPQRDFDLAGYGLVAWPEEGARASTVLPPWTAKEAFSALAATYAAMR